MQTANGTAKPAVKNGKPQNGSPAVVKVAETTPQVAPQVPTEPKPLAAAERVERAQQFNALVVKYEQCKERKQSLAVFKAGAGKDGCKVVLQNGSSKLELNNTEAILEVVKLLDDKATTWLNETEKEIETFTI